MPFQDFRDFLDALQKAGELLDEQKAADVPAGEVCGPAVAEHGHRFFKVADVPGWQDYDFPELRKRSKS